MSQRHVWIAAACLFVLLCSAGVVGTVLRDHANTVEDLERDTRTLARLIAAHAEQGLASAQATLDRAGALLAETSAEEADAREALRIRLDDLVLSSSGIGTLWAIDAAGMRWINNNDAAPVRSDLSHEPYFAAFRDGRTTIHVGPTAIGTVRLRPRFTLARPVTASDGRFAGVVVGGIDVRFFELIYERVQAGTPVALGAFNGDGDPLAVSGADDPAVMERARAAIATAPDRAAVTVDDWIFATVRLDPMPVTVIAGRNVSAALADWRLRAYRLGGLGLLMVAGFLLLTVQGLSAIRREEAARRAMQAAHDDLERRVQERTATVELLFRELNHRVKNNLQIVASLLRLQLRKTDDPTTRAVLQDSVNRIFAIADVHSEIENAENGAISLKSYVGKIVERICDAMRKPDQTVATRVEVADAELALDRAVLIAIALNETVTNAFKHAFANRSDGLLEITVSVTDRRLVLLVRNDVDPALPQPPTTRGSGLGSSIITMLVQQMAGSLAIEEDAGYTVRMEVPLA